MLQLAHNGNSNEAEKGDEEEKFSEKNDDEKTNLCDTKY